MIYRWNNKQFVLASAIDTNVSFAFGEVVPPSHLANAARTQQLVDAGALLAEEDKPKPKAESKPSKGKRSKKG